MARIVRLAYAICDGTLVPTDRLGGTNDRRYYAGKHRRHGLNTQVIADPAGRLVWVSPALPGSTHDLTAARTHGLIDALAGANVMTFADKAYQGAGGSVRTPFKRHHPRPPLSRNQKAVNRAHARIRGIGERAVATLKTWRWPPPGESTPVGAASNALARPRSAPCLDLLSLGFVGEAISFYDQHAGVGRAVLCCAPRGTPTCASTRSRVGASRSSWPHRDPGTPGTGTGSCPPFTLRKPLPDGDQK
jgi:hypothetical protein